MDFIQIGSEYISTADVEEVYQGIDINILLSTPIIVIPENIRNDDKDKEAVLLNLGRFNASTKNIKYDKTKNYKEINDPDKLYDNYKLEFEGFRLTMVRNLDRYENWESCKEKIDIIQDIVIVLRAQRCVSPNHPIMPKLIFNCSINEIDIYFSDYIMVNLLQTQDSLMTALDMNLTLEEKLNMNLELGEIRRRSIMSSSLNSSNTSTISEDEGDSEESGESEDSEEGHSQNSSMNDNRLKSEERFISNYTIGDEESSEEISNYEGGEESKDSQSSRTSQSHTLNSKEKYSTSYYTAQQNETSNDETSKKETSNNDTFNTPTSNYNSFSEESKAEDSFLDESETSNSNIEIRNKKLQKESLFPSKINNPKTHIGNVRIFLNLILV